MLPTELSVMTVGVVIPTLGNRQEYLQECIDSIRQSGESLIAIVRPRGSEINTDILARADLVVDDDGVGLAAAINKGVESFPGEVMLVSWLGDDDRLTANSLSYSEQVLVKSDRSAVYGKCSYIDGDGKEIWLNRSGTWAAKLMRVGPQLVPQPGVVIKRVDWSALGGLDESLRWAFDLDLFIRLEKMRSGLCFIDRVVADFRWHEGSLTVGQRSGSVSEASKVRVQHAPSLIRPIMAMWEPMIRKVIKFAGTRLSKRVTRISNF